MVWSGASGRDAGDLLPAAPFAVGPPREVVNDGLGEYGPARPPGYRLTRGDRVAVMVFDLSGPGHTSVFVGPVQSDGRVGLPYVGWAAAEGRTADEFAAVVGAQFEDGRLVSRSLVLARILDDRRRVPGVRDGADQLCLRGMMALNRSPNV